MVAQLVGQLIRQAVRLGGNGFRQAGLLQQHRHGVGFGTTVSAGNGGTADGLRQDLLGEFEERLVAFVTSGGRILAFIGGTRQQGRQFWQAFVALQSFQIVKNRLLD